MGRGRDFSSMKIIKSAREVQSLPRKFPESHLERFPSLAVPGEHTGGEREPLHLGHGQLRLNELVMLDASHADNL